jgi:hypothetical protein
MNSQDKETEDDGYIALLRNQRDTAAAERDELRKRIEQLDNMVAIQLTDGNWNYDPYMHGMANGLLVAQAALHDSHDFTPLSAPAEWLIDKDSPKALEEAPAP